MSEYIQHGQPSDPFVQLQEALRTSEVKPERSEALSADVITLLDNYGVTEVTARHYYPSELGHIHFHTELTENAHQITPVAAIEIYIQSPDDPDTTYQVFRQAFTDYNLMLEPETRLNKSVEDVLKACLPLLWDIIDTHSLSYDEQALMRHLIQMGSGFITQEDWNVGTAAEVQHAAHIVRNQVRNHAGLSERTTKYERKLQNGYTLDVTRVQYFNADGSPLSDDYNMPDYEVTYQCGNHLISLEANHDGTMSAQEDFDYQDDTYEDKTPEEIDAEIQIEQEVTESLVKAGLANPSNEILDAIEAAVAEALTLEAFSDGSN